MKSVMGGEVNGELSWRGSPLTPPGLGIAEAAQQPRAREMRGTKIENLNMVST